MIRLIIIATLLALISSCKVTEKKAKDYAYSNKDKLAEWCADCFPVKPSEIIKGDTIVKLDTITRIDSVRVTVQADCPDGTIVEVDCPPIKVVTVERHTHTSDTVKVRDTAKEAVLSNERDKATIGLSNMTDSRNKWRKWFLILSGIVGLGIIAKLKGIF